MKSFEVTAVSLRVGQIRLDDIAPQVGDAMSVEVVVVDLGGIVQHVPLAFTAKWGSRGWCRVFQCSRCHAPAQILQVEDNAGLCCRCCPRLTLSQRYRNNRSWGRADELLDKLTRSLLKAPTKALAIRHRRMAVRVTKSALAQVAHVVERARALANAVDTLLASRPDMFDKASDTRRTAQRFSTKRGPESGQSTTRISALH